jgi:hypothetical protein
MLTAIHGNGVASGVFECQTADVDKAGGIDL